MTFTVFVCWFCRYAILFCFAARIFVFSTSLSYYLRCKLRFLHTRAPIISSVVFVFPRVLFTLSNLLLSPQCCHLFIIVFLRLHFVPFVCLLLFSFPDVFIFLSFFLFSILQRHPGFLPPTFFGFPRITYVTRNPAS